MEHRAVLLKEVVEALLPGEGKVLMDATFGRGGHTAALLERGAKVVACDQDPEAVVAGEALRQRWGEETFSVRKMNFRGLRDLVREEGPFDGVLADLGVSSPQLECGERGFSFQEEGPLDMRMDPDSPERAEDLLRNLGERELANLFYRYGGERRSRVIAREVVRIRGREEIRTTRQLAELVERVAGRGGSKIHPATKTFQALRIAVNDELGALEAFLDAAPDALKKGGRLAVISFHELEDRMVKRAMARWCEEEIRGERYAFGTANPEYCMRKIGRWLPEEEEVRMNPRARSARLRVVEKR